MAAPDTPTPEAFECVRFADFVVDVAGHTVTGPGGRDVPVTRAEFALLLAFLRAPGRVLSRDHLLDAVAGRQSAPFDRSIDMLIYRLRRKIEAEPKVPRLLLTVPGLGYKFAAKPVQVAPAQDKPAEAGEPPTVMAIPSAGRRRLTVMVCSLSVGTESLVQLDPEERLGILRAFRACCGDVCGRFGGAPGPVAGDTVHLYFGYPVAHEHDAEQAVRAGLALVEAARRLDMGQAVRFEPRVGIATGEAVADGEPSGEVFGEAPALAQRLAACTGSGTVAVAAATRRLAGGLFEYRALNAADGMPPESFQVLGEAAVATRFDALHAGTLTPLVGRTEETALLLQRWQRAQAGRGNVVLLSGEPGIGKSRLVYELRNRLADAAHLPMIYFCAPHRRDSPYHPFIQHLEHAAGLARLDDAEKRLNKLRALLAEHGSHPDALALFADLLSIQTDSFLPKLNLSPQQRRERTATALITQVVAAAARAPVLLVFEDAQWMDQTSLEVVDALLDRVPDLPVLVIVTFRPEFLAPWSGHPQAMVQVLNRLDYSAARGIVDQLSAGAMPDSLSQRIMAQADGVPLFLEELTKTMLEGGAEAGASLPATLHDSLTERLDRLPAAKRVAQLGAAIGRSFSHELVAALAGVAEEELCSALGQLASSGLVARRGVPPDATYTFKHALVQTAAHESMLKTRRVAIHARIAELLVALEPGIEDSQPDLLAHHCESGGLAEKAAVYYTQAGWKSLYHAAYEDSREQFRNAQRVAATLPEGEARDLVELRALRGFGGATSTIEGYASASFGTALLRALELCNRVGQPPEFLGINFSISTFQSFRNDLSGGLKTAGRLLKWGQLRGDIRGCILGEFVAGRSTVQCGALATARSHLQRAAELLESSWDDPAIIWTYRVAISRGAATCNIHSYLSRVLCLMGYPEQALTHSSASVEQRDEEQRLFIETMHLGHHLWILSVLGEARDLAAPAEKMAELTCRHDLRLYAAIGAIMRGYGIAHSGQIEAGQSAISDGLVAYARTGAVRDSCFYRALLAETHRMMGKTDSALSILTAALEEAERTGEKCYDAELHRGIGEAHYQRGAIQAAGQAFRRALAIARDQGARLWELNAATSYARLLLDQGERKQACALLAPIYNWFSEGFDTVPLRRAGVLYEATKSSALRRSSSRGAQGRGEPGGAAGLDRHAAGGGSR